jgi:hypothetical protein
MPCSLKKLTYVSKALTASIIRASPWEVSHFQPDCTSQYPKRWSWLYYENLKFLLYKLGPWYCSSTLNKEFLKELIHILSLHYLTVKFQLHCLTWFPLLHPLPWLLVLNDGSSCGIHCLTSMDLTVIQGRCFFSAVWSGCDGWEVVC